VELYVSSNSRKIRDTLYGKAESIPISYNIKMELVIVSIKGKIIIINFNILLLENNKAVLGMPWL